MKNRIYLKNEDKLRLIHFIYSQRKLAGAFFLYLIDKYKKIEQDNFLNKEYGEISLYLFPEELTQIRKDAIERIDMSKNNKNFSTEKKESPDKLFWENVSYIVNEEHQVNIFRLKESIREFFNKMSLDDPSSLAETVKINMQNIMDRELNKDNKVSSEIEFLKILNSDFLKLSDLKMKHKEEAIDEKYINKEKIDDFSKNIIDNIQREVLKIPDINTALNIKTNDLLNIIENSSINDQIEFINVYLNKTKMALVQFFNKNSKSSMNRYMQSLNIYFKLIKKYSDAYQDEWGEIFSYYKKEKELLVETFNIVILNLEGKEEKLKVKSKIERFLNKFIIDNEVDSENRQKEKRHDFKEFFGILKREEYMKKKVTERINKEVNIDIVKNLWIENHMELIELSEEEIKEIEEKEKEQLIIDMENIEKENLKNKKKNESFLIAHKLFMKYEEELNIDTFKDDAMAIFDRIYVEDDLPSLFEGIFSKEEISDKRVLYRIIEDAFHKKFNNKNTIRRK